MKLFVTILLDFIPIKRIRKVWKDSKGVFELPNNPDPFTFHRKYTFKMWKAMGYRAELWRWRKAFIKFLQEKIPPNEKCAFKWEGFYMTDAEIDDVVSRATFHYGMERQGFDS